MPTITPNLNLTEPDIGSQNWGGAMNANLVAIDTACGLLDPNGGFIKLPNSVRIMPNGGVPNGATGVGTDGKSSIRLDFADGAAYINQGTIGSPVWNALLTTASTLDVTKLSSVTGTGAVVLANAPAFTANPTFPSSTGSGAVVLATGPTISAPTVTGTAAMASATLSGTITNYNGIVTTGVGIPSLVAAPVDLTGQNTSIPTTTLFTPTATGMYRVAWSAAITMPDSGSPPGSTLGGLQVSYTSPTDSIIKTSVAQADWASTANGIGTAVGGSVSVYAKTGQPVQYTFSYASNAAGSMVYELHIRVERI